MQKSNAAELRRIERCCGAEQYTMRERLARAALNIFLEVAFREKCRKYSKWSSKRLTATRRQTGIAPWASIFVVDR